MLEEWLGDIIAFVNINPKRKLWLELFGKMERVFLCMGYGKLGGGGWVKKTATISCLVGQTVKIITVSVLWKTRCTIALVLITSIVHQVVPEFQI